MDSNPWSPAREPHALQILPLRPVNQKCVPGIIRETQADGRSERFPLKATPVGADDLTLHSTAFHKDTLVTWLLMHCMDACHLLLKPLSHDTGLAKWMETKQSLFKYVNVRFLHGYHMAYMFCVCCVSIDLRQMFCRISHMDNKVQESFVSGSVSYINPVTCDRGFTLLFVAGLVWFLRGYI